MNIKDKILNDEPVENIGIPGTSMSLLRVYQDSESVEFPFLLHCMELNWFVSYPLTKFQAYDIVCFLEMCGHTVTGLKYYSDNARHLVCLPYSIENLHIMADDLNIKRCWFHNSKHPHYDIPKRRIAEIQAKTTILTPSQLLNIIKGLQDF